MNRLFTHIEDINIKGSPDELSRLISQMDMSMQNIAESTERISHLLLKYSNSNKGDMYRRVVNTLLKLRETLYESSMELNSIQNDIVEYQNKIFRYEGLSKSAPPPNKYLVQRTSINTDTSAVQFNRSEMETVASNLKNYNDFVFHQAKLLIESKKQAASVWRDSQYIKFSEFIDSVCRNIEHALKKFDEYRMILEQKIKELN